jgi:hypothetical protein
MRRALWAIIASVVVAVGIAMMAGGFGVLSMIGAALSGQDKPSIFVVVLVLAVAFGLFSLIFGAGKRVVAYFSPKGASPQLTLAKLAKRYFKSGDLHKAARFYAELVTYGFSDNFYVDTERAYRCWKKLGLKAEEMAFSAPFRDLLFYERLVRHAEMRGRGNEREWGSVALGYLEELVGLASNSERLLALGQIYHDDSRISHIAPALRGTFLTTNSVSGAEMTSRVPEALQGKKFHGLADAFEMRRR